MKNLSSFTIGIIGLIIVSVVSAVYSTTTFFEPDLPLSFYHGLIGGVIMVVLVLRRLVSKKTVSRVEWLSILGLFTINCFTLSNDMELFSPAAIWVYGGLGAMFVLRFFYDNWINPPIWLSIATYFFTGLGLVISLYYTVYMIPLTGIGVAGMAILGIGVHVFIPIMLTITLIVFLNRDRPKGYEQVVLGVGAALPILAVIILSVKWHQVNRLIAEAPLEQSMSEELPRWISISQRIQSDFMTRTKIIGDFRYDFTDLNRWGLFSFSGNGAAFDQGRIHDPVLNVAHLIAGPSGLTEDDRLKLLRTALNARHLTERKLWTGRDLSISDIQTEITVFPEYRIAYTEKTFLIKNNSWELNQSQEALFTFYLPEGSTSSSMSLWVNGEERRSRLTTREKADRAYRRIVGIDRRDPALLHWQEGNRLTLTVFPCTPAEERKVKVGFTIPLQEGEDGLSYRSVYFEGPRLSGQEEIKLNIGTEAAMKELPSWLRAEGNGNFSYRGKARMDWELGFAKLPIPPETFSFNNNCYRMETAETEMRSFQPENIYLDINANWEKKEFEAICRLFKDQKIYVYDKGFRALTDQNRRQLFRRLQNLRFSIFPIGKIPEPERQLLITKSSRATPFYSDLKGVKGYFDGITNTPFQLRSFSLSNNIPGYMRHFIYSGNCQVRPVDLAGLKYYVENSGFPDYKIDSTSTVVEESGVRIRKELGCGEKGEAPDHLLRLYSYNKILERHSRQSNGPEVDLIGEANEAFVVSPVSSLIVLETQADYERFDIDVNDRSLKNAAIKSDGGVPEPHEWAIILVCTGLIFFTYRQKLFV